jgi:hypothetical protein
LGFVGCILAMAKQVLERGRLVPFGDLSSLIKLLTNFRLVFANKRRAAKTYIREAAVVKAKHIFLALAAIAISIGVCANGNIYMDIGLPLGVILFGLSLIATVMQKESALYDAQLAAQNLTPLRPARQSTREVAAKTPALTHAHSH